MVRLISLYRKQRESIKGRQKNTEITNDGNNNAVPSFVKRGPSSKINKTEAKKNKGKNGEVFKKFLNISDANLDDVQVMVDKQQEREFLSDSDHSEGSVDDETMLSEDDGEISMGKLKMIDDLSDEQILQHPKLKSIFDRMVNKKIEESKEKGETSNSMLLSTRTPNNTPSKRVAGEKLIKSPSDTTIYAPGLNKKGEGNKQSITIQWLSRENDMGQRRNNFNTEEMVSNFVESVRQEARDDQGDHRQVVTDTRRIETTSDIAPKGYLEAEARAKQAVIEAEKFKAQIEAPGNQLENLMLAEQGNNGKILSISEGASDDNFFHEHIEPSLIQKIENGEFVDLDKLLPKEKIGRNQDDDILE